MAEWGFTRWREIAPAVPWGTMFGYILALCLGAVLLVLGLAALARSGTRGGRPPVKRPVQPEQPAADEPTPDRSVTASTREREAARRVTPPA